MSHVQGVNAISKALGFSYYTTQLLLFLGYIEATKIRRGKQLTWQVSQEEIARIHDLRENPPTYNVDTLGKEFVEQYGYQYPKYRFDEFDQYQIPQDDATAEPVLIAGSSVELLPNEATPHTLTQEGIASDLDWCDFLNAKRTAVELAGPLIYSQKEMDKWARNMRRKLPSKKLVQRRHGQGRLFL